MDAIKSFLEKDFYWNTVGEWLLALGIILASVMAGRLLFWVLSNVVKKLTERTETKLDDILLDMVEEPIAFAVAILGIWYGLDSLNLPDVGHVWINRIYYLLIIFNVAWLVNRVLDALIQEYIVPIVEKSESDLDDQLLPILKKGIHAAVWIMATIVGLNNAGYDVGALIAGLGIGGLAFALAAQDTVANFFGGITIFVDKPFTVNDWIIINGHEGIVEEVGIRSTRIRTFPGRLITIPNKVFAESAIENVSAEPSRRVILMLGLTYDTSHTRIKEALGILAEIYEKFSPQLEEKHLELFDSFGDFSLNVKFVYYIKKGEDVFQTNSAINLEILERFNTAGLDFAFPTQTIHATVQK
ncbi:MAG: mechanosensitive ion channel family protein [Flavobacteriales bacterium]|nr:mechanosensitive ion channel family protein [Flavobacteriales bacterium]